MKADIYSEKVWAQRDRREEVERLQGAVEELQDFLSGIPALQELREPLLTTCWDRLAERQEELFLYERELDRIFEEEGVR